MGVRVGMPIAQASELAVVAEHEPKQGPPKNSAPHPQGRQGKTALPPYSLMHDPVLDAQAIAQVACELQKQISPLVAIESLDQHPWAGRPLHQPDALLCDVSGIAHLFGGEQGLLKAADRQLGMLGLTGRMAIADSVGAAWALAHYRDRSSDSPNSPSPAPASHHIDTAEELQRLPVEALRIPTSTVQTLARLGVTRIDQLLRLPRPGLATRLGDHLIRRIGQLLGEIDEPIVVHHAPAEDRHSLELEYATDDLAILSDRLATLTEKVRAGLATRQRGALRLACCLALADHPPLTFEIGLFAPTLDATHMFHLLVGCIENRKLPGPVNRITVSVTLSGPLRTSQTSLFQDSPKLAASDLMSGSSLTRMLDSLSGRLGRDAVLGVLPSNDPLPENAYQLYPLTGHSGLPASKSRRPASKQSAQQVRSQNASLGSSDSKNNRYADPSHFVQPSCDDALRRPLNLFDSPLPLSPVDDGASNQLPKAFRLGGKLHRIVRHWGPERIETGWWYGPSIRRDYYRIETDQGQWWWVYRNLTSESSTSPAPRRRHWMLHGRFA